MNQILVRCPFCGGVHGHEWFDETQAQRSPTCGAPGASYIVVVGVKERVDAMRSQYSVPDGAVSLVPLHVSYAYENDDDEDIVAIVCDTALGKFALWLELENAIALAGHLVTIADRRSELREAYAARQGLPA